MKRTLLFITLALMATMSWSQWKPAGDNIKTAWAQKIDPDNVLSEYPRPIMERSDWLNLNGLWDYSILPVNSGKSKKHEGKILVPFAVESSLSGVRRTVGADSVLWYERSFTVPSKWKSKNVLLNFGAVDWRADVWVNDIKIGFHEGGYVPFSFDITPFLTSTGTQKLMVKVWDPTDKGPQPRGKQKINPSGIWYTPVTGIWQTVWLEPVEKSYISNVYTVPDIDRNSAAVNLTVSNPLYSQIIEVKVLDQGQTVLIEKSAATQSVELNIENPKLWSPDSPFLYDLEITLYNNGIAGDKVKSYFAMRKSSIGRDENGIMRMQLNNKDIFQFGPLDQGWWPDGLYTAPTDEALKFDIQKTKDLGFNMIRKHVKVEPARWYTWCDKMGILVWQDMPHGDGFPGWQRRNYYKGNEPLPSQEWESTYRKEWKEIMDYCRPYPSIVVWVPFNEGWGQFKTPEIVAWTQAYDPSRLVNPASGGNHFPVGDILDLHNYPQPELYLYDAQRATVMGEYGGIGYAIDGHLWKPDNNWGYIKFKSTGEVTDTYVEYAETLKKLIKAGISAAVYTQTTDVEIEVNGLLTYDRKLVKVDEERIRKVNQEVINTIR